MVSAWRLCLIVAVVLLAGCGERREAMVATANIHASRAAFEILKEGGSAADAAIAAQLVLGLVEPQSSGLGGGAFLLFWDAAERRITAWDGRETAPRAAGPDLFLGPDGKPMAFEAAAIGGRAVGVPGAASLLWEVHRRHGRLDWERLFEPAIRLAEQGFQVSERLSQAIAGATGLAEDATARSLYFQPKPDAAGIIEAVPAGHLIRNPAYAQTLRLIAARGPAAFYHGEVAEAIVAAVTGHGRNPGLMTVDDLARFRAKARAPVCLDYRDHEVCGMPPPTSGGLTTLMILGLVEPYRMGGLRPNSPTAVHLIAQASRLAYADRALYMADPDFVPVPDGLLDRDYLRARARLIDPGRDRGEAKPGVPPRMVEMAARAASLTPESGTSHLAIVDGDGNAVSMTTSVEQSFGARIMAAGMVLNNQLTDFAFEPERDGREVANRVEGGKRPRSSMSPTIVIAPDGALFAAVGSPGGSRIIGYVAHTLVALIDWRLTMQEAIDLPRFVNRNVASEVEAGTALAAAAPLLEAMGHRVDERELASGLHGIRRHDGRLDGGADRRREGVVIAID